MRIFGLFLSSSFMIVSGHEPCANITFLKNGEVDIQAALYQCSNSIGNPNLINSYFDEIPINVQSQWGLNNLININEIEGTATFDCYFRLSNSHLYFSYNVILGYIGMTHGGRFLIYGVIFPLHYR